eukprot:272460_1
MIFFFFLYFYHFFFLQIIVILVMSGMDNVLPTIIITGASQGIGRCTAVYLSRYDTPRYKLALLARNTTKLGETKELCCKETKSMRRNVEIFKCDITKTDELKECVNYIGTNFGPLCTVINNAGVLF